MPTQQFLAALDRDGAGHTERVIALRVGDRHQKGQLSRWGRLAVCLRVGHRGRLLSSRTSISIDARITPLTGIYGGNCISTTHQERGPQPIRTHRFLLSKLSNAPIGQRIAFSDYPRFWF